MYRLSFKIIFLLLSINIFAQSPHGDKFDIDCSNCHMSDNWKVQLSHVTFDHSTTKFNLEGQHQNVNCNSCHTSLIFSNAPTDCFSCHKDIHQETVGLDCASCHNPTSWIVKDIIGIHQSSRFPLLGAHKLADCTQCHSGYSELKFDVINADCYACHAADYNSAQSPNHIAAKFSTDCQECHTVSAFTWNTTNVNHSFFPLTGGHALPSCFACHQQDTFSGLSPDCYSCHQQDYQNVNDPNHVTSQFPTDCSLCHTTAGWDNATIDHNLTQFPLTGNHVQVDCANCHTNGYAGTPTDCYACHQTNYNNTTNPNHQAAGFPVSCVDCHSTTAWAPATFDHDTQYFPIYSGKHNGEWNQCSDCHTIPNNFSTFSCIDCHEHNRTDTDDKHQGVQGYVYNSSDCFACHPTGRKEGAFNHATSSFTLVGVHLNTDCIQCHENGYSNTSTLCSDCHIAEYNSSANPNHQTLSLSTDCAVCHTPTANWQPALFPQHNQVFQLIGRHLEIANDCESCHSGNYTTTSNECVGCHQSAFNNAVNPNHATAGIPTSCQDCHGSSAWIPSSFNHTITGFELIGSHQPLQCSSCHLGTVTGLNNQCITCHQVQFNTALNHTAQSYPTNCELCHNSVAWNQASFDHQNTSFPLTGAHTTTTCQDCHSSGYAGTPTDCFACHQTDYQQSTNPNHTTLGLSTSCQNCHTTNPGWAPATFPVHDSYFQLLGAHLQINDCIDCHQGNYNTTPNTCIGCHSSEYNGTNDPPHQVLTFSENCLTCHSMNGWTPATFDHSFYAVNNRHSNVNCNECHSEPNYQPQCLTCHMDDFLDEHDLGDRTDCWNCHNARNWDIGLLAPHRQRTE